MNGSKTYKAFLEADIKVPRNEDPDFPWVNIKIFGTFFDSNNPFVQMYLSEKFGTYMTIKSMTTKIYQNNAYVIKISPWSPK